MFRHLELFNTLSKLRGMVKNTKSIAEESPILCTLIVPPSIPYERALRMLKDDIGTLSGVSRRTTRLALFKALLTTAAELTKMGKIGHNGSAIFTGFQGEQCEFVVFVFDNLYFPVDKLQYCCDKRFQLEHLVHLYTYVPTIMKRMFACQKFRDTCVMFTQ